MGERDNDKQLTWIQVQEIIGISIFLVIIGYLIFAFYIYQP